MYYKKTWKTKSACFALAYSVCFFMRNYITELLFTLLFNDIIWKFTNNIIYDTLLFFLIILFPVLTVHEWIHGTVLKLLGGKVSYRFRGLYFKFQEVSKSQLSRTKYLIVLMAPLMIVSLLSLALPMWIGGALLLLNLFISTEDILRTAFLCRVGNDEKIVITEDGFETSKIQEAVQMTFENI